MSKVAASFLMETIQVPLEKILPSRKFEASIKETTRYKMIASSIAEVGVVEPIVVYPQGKTGTYTILDGHLRWEVLKDRRVTMTTCLVSTDDEACTYNHRVSRLAPIQENRMIVNAIEAGVPEERIAKALNVSVGTIRTSRNRLKGICPDAIETLKDKPITDGALALMKRVKPYRQVEMADLMAMSSTYSASYAKALFAATVEDQLVAPLKTTAKPEQIAKLESEMRATERDFVMAEQSYSRDTLNLQLARAYLKKLLENARVAKYLGQRHSEVLAQLRQVVEMSSLDA